MEEDEDEEECKYLRVRKPIQSHSSGLLVLSLMYRAHRSFLPRADVYFSFDLERSPSLDCFQTPKNV